MQHGNGKARIAGFGRRDFRLSPFVLCMIGMTVGMAVDHRIARFPFGGFCAADRGVLAAIERHVSMMPAMYIGVAAAIAIGLCRDARVAPGTGHPGGAAAGSLLCTGLMLAGMTGACLIAMRLSPWMHPAGAWLAMTVGMLAGHGVHALGRRTLGGMRRSGSG